MTQGRMPGTQGETQGDDAQPRNALRFQQAQTRAHSKAGRKSSQYLLAHAPVDPSQRTIDDMWHRIRTNPQAVLQAARAEVLDINLDPETGDNGEDDDFVEEDEGEESTDEDTEKEPEEDDFGVPEWRS